MRTSLNSTKIIDDYLFDRMPAGDKLLFEANLILNDDLVTDMAYQQRTYVLIKQYGRKNIKAEIAAVQQKLTAAPANRAYVQRIINLFKQQ